jgi:archaellum component FlaF (FlaF/FlaG flagellin family)
MKRPVEKAALTLIVLAAALTANGCDLLEMTDEISVLNAGAHPISVSVVAAGASENDSPQYALPGDTATVTITYGFGAGTSDFTVHVLDLTTGRLYSNTGGGVYPDDFLDPW